MKVAQLYHWFAPSGGAERHIEQLSAELTRRGNEITIVSGNPPADCRGFALSFSRQRIFLSAVRLAAWLKSQNIDVVHVHSRRAALVAGLATRIYRVPVVVTCHILPRGYAWCSFWGDATICVSHAVREHLERRFGVPHEKLVVIHNGLPVHYNPDDHPTSGPPLPHVSHPAVALVARFVPGKGHQLFLEAARDLVAAGFPGTFILAGDGPLEYTMRREYSHRRILFLGMRRDIPRLMRLADATVIASESEAFPYVGLESLAAGTPLIATNCGGTGEMMTAGRDGYLYPIGDCRALTTLLKRLSAGDLRLDSRAEIAQRCRRRFSFGRMVDATLDVYARCRFYV